MYGVRYMMSAMALPNSKILVPVTCVESKKLHIQQLAFSIETTQRGKEGIHYLGYTYVHNTAAERMLIGGVVTESDLPYLL